MDLRAKGMRIKCSLEAKWGNNNRLEMLDKDLDCQIGKLGTNNNNKNKSRLGMVSSKEKEGLDMEFHIYNVLDTNENNELELQSKYC